MLVRNRKKGSAYAYIVLLMFLVIVLFIIFNKFIITHLNEREKTVSATNIHNFVNDMEEQLQHNTLINLYDETKLSQTYNDETYTITLTPPSEFTTKEIEDTINFNRDSLFNKEIFYNSNSNNQLLAFVENNFTNKTEKYLLTSNLFSDNILYTLAGTEIELEKEPNYKRVAYRVNGGQLQYKSDYPLSTQLNLGGTANENIYDLYYMSEKGEILKWQRFTGVEYTERKEDEFTYNFVQIPNRDIKIRDDVIYNYNSYNNTSLKTEVNYDSGLNKNLVVTRLNLNLINNLTTDYEVEVSYEVYDPTLPVKYESKYTEGSETFSIYDGITNSGKINFKQPVTQNYPYSNKDLIMIYDEARKMPERQIGVKLDNALITEVKVKYNQFESANFNLKAINNKGQIVREKPILITK